MVLISSTLPGYLLGLLVLGCIPAVLTVSAFLSQVVGSWAYAWAVFFYMASVLHGLRIAKVFWKDKKDAKVNAKTLEKSLTKIGREALFLKFNIWLGASIFAGHRIYMLSNGNVTLSSISRFIEDALGKGVDAGMLAAMVAKYFFLKYVTILAAADLTM